MNEVEILKKPVGKSVPLTITKEIREHIKIFKDNLQYMYNDRTLTSNFDMNTIHIILNVLDDYDRNLLIAYYSVAECNISKLEEVLGVSKQALSRRLKLIEEKIKELNDVPKTIYNQPRSNFDR
jgi:DNA-directed RNA polymerase specialized sigma subunit